jgi:hypothetical protein
MPRSKTATGPMRMQPVELEGRLRPHAYGIARLALIPPIAHPSQQPLDAGASRRPKQVLPLLIRRWNTVPGEGRDLFPNPLIVG